MYMCKTFKAPELNGTKHHLIRIEPIVQAGHETLVHHILLYDCRVNVTIKDLRKQVSETQCLNLFNPLIPREREEV